MYFNLGCAEDHQRSLVFSNRRYPLRMNTNNTQGAPLPFPLERGNFRDVPVRCIILKHHGDEIFDQNK